MAEPWTDRLELAAIRSALAQRVRTPLGALEVQAITPFPRLADAKERIEGIRQVRILLSQSEAPPVGGAQDVRAALSLGEKGVMLDGPALRAIADTMQAGSGLRRHLLSHESDAPLLYGMAASLVDLSRTADQVSRSFDPDGQLADSASSELGPLRKRVRSLRESIREQITGLLGSAEMQPLLQESYFTIRADRYVLPIKASHKNEVKGIVHDASGSGQTVFIEPSAVVDLGNRLKIAQSEQVEEEHRILSNLTLLVIAEVDAIRQMIGVIALADLLTAGARLADELDCAAIVPGERPGFDLIAARHPLLALQALPQPAVDPRESAKSAGADDPIPEPWAPSVPPTPVVPNDLGLGGEQRILLLTGPNTGGKTVAMKTIGLIATMVRAGLHVPCAPASRLGWFDRIEVAIGDEQSIASHLSTFAAHMKRLLEILERANPKTLVLIDEIAADTDPTQGQALAQAMLERLAERGTHTVVTTHFERLKAVPFSDRRFRNAGVGFDQKLLRPTYKVTLDLPQSSSGLDIARGLGLPAEIVDRAQDLIGEGSRALEKLMADLQARSNELDAARREAELAEREAVLEKQKLAALQEQVERDKQLFRVEARAELLKEIEASRAEVRKMISALQAATENQSARDAMRLATEAQAGLTKIAAAEEAKHKEQVDPDQGQQVPLAEVRVGDWVHVKQLAKDGDVVGIDGKEAQIAVGNMRMRIPLSALYPARTRRPKKSERVDPKRLRRELNDAQARKPVGGPKVTEELDVRGHDINESLDRLDAFLDHHYGTPTTHVRIVHGHGTGALKAALRGHLKASGYVRSMRPGDDHEGGDGATIVELA